MSRRTRSKMMGAMLAAVLTAGLLAATAQAKKPPKPPPEPANPAIAYARDGYLHVMDADGSNEMQVVDSVRTFRAPSWSPDGQQIAFVTNESSRRICKVNVDGAGLTTLATGPTSELLYPPRWSPGSVLGQGEKIIFTTRAEGYPTRDIFMMDTDGSNLVQLTDRPDLGAHTVEWMPGSDRIFVQMGYGDLFIFELGLVDGEIQVVSRINCTEEAAAEGVSFPDPGYPQRDAANTEDSVALQAIDGDLYVLDVTSPYGCSRVASDSDVGGPVGRATWSPDDGELAFSVAGSARGKDPAGIWVMDASGANKTRILKASGTEWPEWWAGATP